MDMAYLSIVYFLLHTAAFCIGQRSTLDRYITHQFPLNSSFPTLHITLNDRDGKIYISAVNRLYQLDKNLDSSSFIEVETGPKSDSIRCLPKQPCDSRTLTNNYNKMMVMDPLRDRLIVCGSIYQGICELRSLANISQIVYQDKCSEEPCGFDINFGVCCLNEKCTCIGVLAEGPTVGNMVLYTASTNSESTYMASSHNTISSRSLHVDPNHENLMLRFAVDNDYNKRSEVDILVTDGDSKLDVYFEYAFEIGGSDGFVYFLYNRDKTNKTVISRLCKDDPQMRSYVEMELTCSVSGQLGTEILSAYFQSTVGTTDLEIKDVQDGALYITYASGSGSLVCVYGIKYLNNMFDDTVLGCYKYKGKDPATNRAVIVESSIRSCVSESPFMAADASLDDESVSLSTKLFLPYYPGYDMGERKYRCGSYDLPSYLKRKPPVKAIWSFYQPDVNFSTIVVDLVPNKINVAFIGTQEGSIVKLDVNHKRIYSTIDVGSPVEVEMVLDHNTSLSVPHLYFATPSQIYHIKVSACEQYTSCTDCLGANDPYCGWCILTNTCVPKSFPCPSRSWLKPLSSQCMQANVAEPLERNSDRMVVLQVKLLPTLSGEDKYSCQFGGGVVKPANVNSSNEGVLTCQPPENDQLPKNYPGEDYVNVTVSIRYNDDTEIISTEATFYQCSAHGQTINRFQPCQGCINNMWSNKCHWCVQKNQCESVYTASDRCLSQSQLCPMITSGANVSKFISVGVEQEILLNVANLPTSSSDMSCSVMIDDENTFKTRATLISQTQVRCEKKIYRYTEEKPEVPANVSVFWKPNAVVDIQTDSPIIIYNCSVSRTDCSLCLSWKPEYRCRWCGSKCIVQEACDEDFIIDAAYCPAPTIKSFAPTSGSISGNTLVNISGTDMGVIVSDVQSISVAGVPCRVVEDYYQISNRVSCQLNAADVGTVERSGKVTVTVRGLTAESKDVFFFKKPEVRSVGTPEGPIAGGTTVDIKGKNLDIGWKRIVTIGSFSCDHPKVLSSTQMQCTTTEANEDSNKNLTLTVSIDGYSVSLPNAFSYIKNPKITGFATANEKMASFLAGGRTIYFTGERLKLIQNADLVAFITREKYERVLGKGSRRKRSAKLRDILTHNRMRRSTGHLKEFKSKCDIQNSTSMTCPSPEISVTAGENITKNLSDSLNIAASLRLMLDNLNIELKEPSGKRVRLKYYPNPTLVTLDPENLKDLREKGLLDIKFYNLNTDAVDGTDTKVMIGEQQCKVDSITEQGIVRCSIPPKPEGEGKQYPVTVEIGNKVWSVGSASYEAKQPALSQGAITGFIVVAVVVLIVAVVATIYCVRKQRDYRANKSGFQQAIEELEMSVRADFRKAFAELSTDMTDLTDIGDAGLPVLHYRQYASNMFFPNYNLCMREPDPDGKLAPGVQQGFAQFDLLISNKQFLMTFIRTLEQQRGFSNRDKINVASLITVVLHKKLDYFTEVMKLLMSELVAASVQKNPKLVLRRTESVADKMFSNWLSICMYAHIRDNVGKPLFLLQKAIKHQVSKGPLDAVTGKTRYTLSDDSLLKEDIPCESFTLFVSQKDSNPDEPIIVKVLSCDTIVQVKEKVMDTIYKRIPFSQRPKADDLELEWRHGVSGHLTLPDHDHVNEAGSRWSRVSTIKDYNVPKNATMGLKQREKKFDGIEHLTSHSPDTSVDSPMLPEDNVRLYHLVKYSDENEQKRESSVLRDKHKHILDLYLLRLINMKGILQSYVDDVFNTLLDTSSYIPPAVKHFFDFLDELAKKNGVEDQDNLHIWKTNSVLSRFWVPIIKHPGSVFDIDKPESVASSMAVISQTFIDACSLQEHQPTKDSPINKQLYAKEIPTYKKLVQKYYSDVRQMQTVSDQEMSAHMTEISRSHDLEFDVQAAHNELWGYVNKYYEEILETLTTDNVSQIVIQRLTQAYTLIYNSTNNP